MVLQFPVIVCFARLFMIKMYDLKSFNFIPPKIEVFLEMHSSLSGGHKA